MIKMQTFINLLISSLMAITAFAQPGTKQISGMVKDVRNEGIPNATVQLLKAGDSTIIKAIITHENGRFRFSGVDSGSYLLSITATGLKPYTSATLVINDTYKDIELPVIVLLPAKSIQLAEVVVTAKRPLIEQDIDKTVVNVASMISSATSNTLEVLEKTPGITVSANGEISLNGKGGVLLLIDGRPTYMSGQDLALYLKSLPGVLLDKIELMDNPPARYDAGGNAIINIRLKKTRAGGFTGNISTGYTQGKYARSNNALNLNYNYKKLNLFGNVSYNHEKTYTIDSYDRRFFDGEAKLVSTVALVNDQENTSRGTNINVGADYTASANTTFGLVVNMNRNKRKGWLDYSSDAYNASNQPDTLGKGTNTGTDKRVNSGANLNFLHKFGKTGRELSGDINYLHYNTDGNQSLQNFLFLPGEIPAGQTKFLYLIPSAINIYTLKTDYVQPLKNEARLEAGFKSSVVDNDHVNRYYDINGPVQTIDNGRSNHFKYRENINAAYVSIQKNAKRLGAQVGLRIENTRSTGEQLGNDVVQGSSFKKDYTQFFPSVFLRYKLDTIGRNSISFSLTRRINRPNYQLLNPFVFFRDKYSYTAGNPLLDPQYQYRYEIRYQHKEFLRMALSYNSFTDAIFQTTQTVDNIFITRPDNIARGYMLLLNTGLSLSPAEWWQLNTDILLSHIGLKGSVNTQKLDPSMYVARINVINQIKMGKAWNAEFGGYYASRDLNGQAYTSGMVRVNAAVQKKIWKERASIKLGIDDIFHSWIYHNKSVDLNRAKFFQTSESDTQRIGLAFTYRFGKDSFARKRKHNDNASDDEKGRVE